MAEVKLEPISNPTMTDQVEERLRAYFKDKGFKIGDPLPKEIEMAQALNVSRNVVREALSRLRMLGMVETRKRRGMVLTEPDVLSGLERMLDPGLLSRDIMKQLFELRLVLEVGISDLLFIRKTEADLQKLEKIVREEAKVKTQEERIELDAKFHSTLYQTTGNDTLRRFQKMLIPLFQYIVEIEAGPDGSTAVGSVSHADLIVILRQGTPAQFREAMKEHLEPHFLFV